LEDGEDDWRPPKQQQNNSQKPAAGAASPSPPSSAAAARPTRGLVCWLPGPVIFFLRRGFSPFRFSVDFKKRNGGGGKPAQ